MKKVNYDKTFLIREKQVSAPPPTHTHPFADRVGLTEGFIRKIGRTSSSLENIWAQFQGEVKAAGSFYKSREKPTPNPTPVPPMDIFFSSC